MSPEKTSRLFDKEHSIHSKHRHLEADYVVCRNLKERRHPWPLPKKRNQPQNRSKTPCWSPNFGQFTKKKPRNRTTGGPVLLKRVPKCNVARTCFAILMFFWLNDLHIHLLQSLSLRVLLINVKCTSSSPLGSTVFRLRLKYFRVIGRESRWPCVVSLVSQMQWLCHRSLTEVSRLSIIFLTFLLHGCSGLP